ncbi:MAG TPA: hydroxymyristoyl-ACP dehydratase [Gammaproteobacteria bacterium]|nr:hydroxymyristoyl-ACP dehydratase [Gammaproteobacteria bacterium]
MTAGPKIVQQSIAESTARIVLAIPRDLEWFDGHFPHAPVVPGVVQLKWAVEHAQRCFAIAAAVKGIEVLKFQRAIGPQTEVTLTLDYSTPRGKVSFSYESDQGRHSSGRIVLSASS